MGGTSSVVTVSRDELAPVAHLRTGTCACVPRDRSSVASSSATEAADTDALRTQWFSDGEAARAAGLALTAPPAQLPSTGARVALEVGDDDGAGGGHPDGVIVSRRGQLLFVSGVTGPDTDDGVASTTAAVSSSATPITFTDAAASETHRVMRRLRGVLTSQSASLLDVLFVHVSINLF